MIFINMNDGSEIFGHEKIFENETTKTFYEKSVVLEAQIILLCIKNKRQSGLLECFECHKMRITGSIKAHKILRLRRKTIANLVNDFLHPKPLQNKHVAYGIKNKKKALEEHKVLENAEIVCEGFFVSPSQFATRCFVYQLTASSCKTV